MQPARAGHQHAGGEPSARRVHARRGRRSTPARSSAFESSWSSAGTRALSARRAPARLWLLRLPASPARPRPVRPLVECPLSPSCFASVSRPGLRVQRLHGAVRVSRSSAAARRWCRAARASSSTCALGVGDDLLPCRAGVLVEDLDVLLGGTSLASRSARARRRSAASPRPAPRDGLGGLAAALRRVAVAASCCARARTASASRWASSAGLVSAASPRVHGLLAAVELGGPLGRAAAARSWAWATICSASSSARRSISRHARAEVADAGSGRPCAAALGLGQPGCSAVSSPSSASEPLAVLGVQPVGVGEGQPRRARRSPRPAAGRSRAARRRSRRRPTRRPGGAGRRRSCPWSYQPRAPSHGAHRLRRCGSG